MRHKGIYYKLYYKITPQENVHACFQVATVRVSVEKFTPSLTICLPSAK
jgi:hypothetical protein